jgi:signal transduction histidine kinase
MDILEFISSQSFNLAGLIVIDVFAAWLIYRVFTSNVKDKLNKLFTFMSVAFLFWVNAGYVFSFSGNLDFSLILGRFILAEVIWSFILLYFLLINFSSSGSSNSLLNKLVIIMGLVYSAVAIFTDFIVAGVEFSRWGIDPLYGPFGKFAYYGFIAFLMILAFYKIVKKYSGFSKEEKKRVLYFFIGIVFFVVMNLVFNVILPILRNSIQYWQFGNYAVIFLLGFTAYAIVEHKLLNIKVIATEVLTLVLFSILLSRLFFSQTFDSLIVDTFILVIVSILGFLLIKSVQNEVEQREKLEDLTQKLKALDAQKDEFISMAAHELRAPMTAIKGYVSMVMEGDTGDIPEKARGFLADANNINDRLIRLVNNMLNVSRIEEGRIVFQMEDENLSRVVKSVFSQFTPEAERKNLKYVLDIPTHIKDKVHVDPDRIQEVVGNLISNAVKYTDQGFVKVTLMQPNDKVVRFEISDSGPGIPEDEQGKLFQKFHRIETNVGKTTGTGLGLYISKLLVEKFNGTIGMKSKPGKGSTFWFELPLTSPSNGL